MLAIYDVVQGAGGTAHFPVPWASRASLSHLVTPDGLRVLLEEAGFAIQSWRDTSEAGCRSVAELARRLRAGMVPATVLGLLFGDEELTIVENLHRNLVESRVGLVEVTARRP